jgi:hypothetical protein
MLKGPLVDPKFLENQDPKKRDNSFATQQLENLPLVNFRRPQKPVEHLIFLHFPKTGGTNIHFIAEALARISKSKFKNKRFGVPIRSSPVPKAAPNLVYRGWQGGLGNADKELAADPNCCKDVDLISGHFPFGLHEKIGVPAQYITLLRDPVERAISCANFDNQRGFVADEVVNEYLLEAEIDNPATRMLAGPEYMSGECSQNTLEKAKANIEKHFLLVGITEDANTFYQALETIQGWGPISMVRSQVTGEKKISEPSPDVIARLQAKHKIDKDLYEWAKARWYKWKAENIASIMEMDPKQQYICIPAEFAKTRIPLLMTADEIAAFNKAKPQELIRVDQIPPGVKPASEVPSAAAPLSAAGSAAAAAAPVVPQFAQKKSEPADELPKSSPAPAAPEEKATKTPK